MRKEAHGSGSGSKQISMPSPQRSQRRTFKDQMLLITQGTSTAKCAVPASPDNPNTATSSNGQLMTTKPDLQKALHVSTRDRQQACTIPLNLDCRMDAS